MAAGTAQDPRSARVIRDPVHDYIVMPLELNALIDTSVVQRLRYVSQTAQASSVYPAMSGYRFEHSLGTMHLVQYAWTTLWSRTHPDVQKTFQDDALAYLNKRPKLYANEAFTKSWVEEPTTFRTSFEKNIRIALGAAALLHDLGHPPFSHALEDFYERNLELVLTGGYFPDAEVTAKWLKSRQVPFHERVGLGLLDSIPGAAVGEMSWYVVRAMLGAGDSDTTWLGALHSLIASEVDVDRLDYLVRDAKRSGTEFYSFDSARLLQSLELHEIGNSAHATAGQREWAIGLGYRARTAAESFLTNRLRYYQWVLFHPHVIAANRMLDIGLQQLVDIGSFAYREKAASADREVGHVFYDAIPNLSYFTDPPPRDASKGRRHPAQVLDPTPSHGRAEVDDATINEWMKKSASLARAYSDVGDVSVQMKQMLDRYLSFYNAIHFREPNWAPVWKTEDDFHKIAFSMKDDIRSSIETLIEETGERLERGTLSDRFTAFSGELARIAPIFDDTHEDERGPTARKSVFDPPEGLNLLSDLAFSHRDPKERFRSLAVFGQIFTRHAAGDLADLGRGEWVFAYQNVSAVRVGDREIHLWKLNERTPLTSLSSMARELPAIAGGYPRLFAYFVAHSRGSMRTGRESPHTADLRAAFVNHFPAAIRDFIRM